MITVRNSIRYLTCVTEARCVVCKLPILNLKVQTMGDTGSFVVIYVDSGYFITGLALDFDCAGLLYRSANTLKSKRTNKRKTYQRKKCQDKYFVSAVVAVRVCTSLIFYTDFY